MWAPTVTENLQLSKLNLCRPQKYLFGHPVEQRTCTGQLSRSSAFCMSWDDTIRGQWPFLQHISTLSSRQLSDSESAQQSFSFLERSTWAPAWEGCGRYCDVLSPGQGCGGIYVPDRVGKQSSSGLQSLLTALSWGRRSLQHPTHNMHQLGILKNAL